MVKALHHAGIEVILDVVYNHTAEGNHLGPIAFKGVDNASCYRLVPDDRRFYMDFTGTGNSLNPVHPSVLRLIMDSLRYFALECHVDGFRFDLASALAREYYDVDRLSAFFDTIHQDRCSPGEADRGALGRRPGRLPGRELPGALDGVERDLPRHGPGLLACAGHRADFAQRFTGSSDLYAEDGRRPFASINFVTAHDGFTLADLVSYDRKHNEANLEGNRDGTDDNRSWNHGVEGPTDDPQIVALRRRQVRNFLVTLLLSQGVPMVLGGDESAHPARQQQRLVPGQRAVVVPLGRGRPGAARVREAGDAPPPRPPGLSSAALPRGTRAHGLGRAGRWWFRPDGRRMTQADWRRGDAYILGVFLNGREIPTPAPDGEPVVDDSFLLLFNSWEGPVASRCRPGGSAGGGRSRSRRSSRRHRATSSRHAGSFRSRARSLGRAAEHGPA